MVPNFKEMYQGTLIVGQWMFSLLLKMFIVSGVMFLFPLAAGCAVYFLYGDYIFSDMIDVMAAQNIFTQEFTIQFLTFAARERNTIMVSWSVAAGLITMFLEFVVAVWLYTVYRFCCHYSQSQMNVKATENSILPS